MWQGETVTGATDSTPPPRTGPRDPGDAWVEDADGRRYWGRFGAAGLVAWDRDRGVLLQHRATWSHFGDTWGLPGGARHEGESAVDGALREAGEEAGVPRAAMAPRLLSTFATAVWTYGTLVADVIDPFEPVISDPESRELKWVPLDEVEALPLHPGLAASWPALRALLPVRPAVVVDAANVVGSVPDGWWRDRAGAAERLLSRVAGLAGIGIDGAALDLDDVRWFPEWSVVLEGQAKAAGDVAGPSVLRAPGEGDDAIVAEASRLVAAGRAVTVVTSDRGLAARVTDAGAAVRGAGWLLDLLP